MDPLGVSSEAARPLPFKLIAYLESGESNRTCRLLAKTSV